MCAYVCVYICTKRGARHRLLHCENGTNMWRMNEGTNHTSFTHTYTHTHTHNTAMTTHDDTASSSSTSSSSSDDGCEEKLQSLWMRVMESPTHTEQDTAAEALAHLILEQGPQMLSKNVSYSSAPSPSSSSSSLSSLASAATATLTTLTLWKAIQAALETGTCIYIYTHMHRGRRGETERKAHMLIIDAHINVYSFIH